MAHFVMKKKHYLAAFSVLLIVNLCMGAYLLNRVFAQTPDLRNQKPVNAEVTSQDNPPILVNVTRVDNTEKNFQTIYFVMQNVSSKPIRANVMLQKDSVGLGKTVVDYFYPPFAAGTTITNSISIERPNVRVDGKAYLSIDYVQFVDGTSWGANSERQSERIFGHTEGKSQAVSHFKNLFLNRDHDSITKLLGQDAATFTPKDLNTQKSELWQQGFVTGFRSVLSTLKAAFELSGIEATSNKLTEIETNAKMGDEK
ncbi:MAG: hypothetical protein ACRD6X_14570 [Pyrinomonadaceae bacterium]